MPSTSPSPNRISRSPPRTPSSHISPSASGTSTLALAPINGFSGTVTLSASAPAGITVTPAAASLALSAPATDVLTLNVAAATASGIYPLTITASGGGHVHTAQILVRVLAVAAPLFSPAPEPSPPRSRSLSPTRPPARPSTTPPTEPRPTASSTRYTGAITVSATETIQAIAVVSGYAPSTVSSATYTIETPAATPIFSPRLGNLLLGPDGNHLRRHSRRDHLLHHQRRRAHNQLDPLLRRQLPSPPQRPSRPSPPPPATLPKRDGLPPLTSSTWPSTDAPPEAAVAWITSPAHQALRCPLITPNGYWREALTPSTPPAPTARRSPAPPAPSTTTPHPPPTRRKLPCSHPAPPSATRSWPASESQAEFPVIASASAPVSSGNYAACYVMKNFKYLGAGNCGTVSATASSHSQRWSHPELPPSPYPSMSTALPGEPSPTAPAHTPSQVRDLDCRETAPPPTAPSTNGRITAALHRRPRPPSARQPDPYTSAQTVTISDTTPGATIYYTTNGTAPTTSSTLYTGAITVSASETIKAIATAPGYLQSVVGAATYTISLSSLRMPLRKRQLRG